MTASHSHIAGINAVFVQSAGTIGILPQKNVTVVVEITNDGSGSVALAQPRDDLRNSARGLAGVDRHANEFRPG